MPGSPVRAPPPGSTSLSVFSETMSMLAPRAAAGEATATHTASTSATTFHRLSSYAKTDYDAPPSPPPPKKQRCLPEIDLQPPVVVTAAFEPLPSAADIVAAAISGGTAPTSGTSYETGHFNPEDQSTGNHAMDKVSRRSK
ncbi:unnamed protein product [Schistocephalus solidus]|uniref:Uncharacterized protein n=1 Tax=Schistocephalus solidus TaxID=70667 RepID=A0A183TCN3_SCHSO|nr:unnamed protein product [Schistocephalus solidus]